MRRVMLATALAAAACTPPKTTTYAVPVETPTPSYGSSMRGGAERVMAVDTLYAWCEGPRLNIIVDARTNSGGWTAFRLNPIPGPDGRRTFEAVGEAPHGPVSDGVLGMRIAHEEAPPFGVERVRVLSQTNQLEAVIQGGPC
ncbi:MAG: hypothetical protein IT548_14645 [Alphaproteobacteria bacterium]|nr:hypothetical protein [Alphaproteobacteria bacterium]